MQGRPALLVKRPFYRVAHVLLRVWWRVARPRVRGVRCVLRRDDQVLLVRHTYGDRDWSLPGGRMRPWEEPEATARREMSEELGLELDGWLDLGSCQSGRHGKRETVFFLGADVGERELTIDQGEIDEVRWAPVAEAADTGSETLREAVEAGVFQAA